ncbi:MAG: Hpt domain-containing protein [Lachnospiraceae bacterium]|nr:Hpt domain-containing protein [Lachnospiraceae bacterium]
MTEMTFDDLKKAGFNVEEGFKYTGDTEKYLAALQRFYRRSGKNISVIKDSISGGDNEVLIITVHALKSNARMIGADELGELAERMELLGKAGDNEGMLALSGRLLEDFDRVIEIIKPYGLMEAVHPASEISAEEAEKTGAALIDAVEDFDDEKAQELIDRLMRYPFRFTLINVLKNAKEDIADYEYTGALLKIRRVISQIED